MHKAEAGEAVVTQSQQLLVVFKPVVVFFHSLTGILSFAVQYEIAFLVCVMPKLTDRSHNTELTLLS